MTFHARLLAAGVALLAAPAGHAGAPAHVFMISVDGLRADLMDRSETPNLDLVARTGCRALAARTVVPAVTLPAHASMLTGVEPERHGVFFNRFDPGFEGLEVPIFLSTVADAGRRAAAFVGKRKLLHLLEGQGLDAVRHSGYTAERVLDAALPYIEATPPAASFLHFPDVDSAGHEHGWGTPEQLRAVEEVDRQIGRLFQAVYRAGILRRSAFLITADHGGHGRAHGLHHPQEFQIEWLAAGLGVQPGHAIEAPVSVLDTGPTVLALLGMEPPAGLDGRVVGEALYAPGPSGEQAEETWTRLGWVPEDLLPTPGPVPPAAAPRERSPVRLGLSRELDEWVGAGGLLPPAGRVRELWGAPGKI